MNLLEQQQLEIEALKSKLKEQEKRLLYKKRNRSKEGKTCFIRKVK